MTIANENGERVSFGKDTPVWETLREWAGDDQSRWDLLTAVALFELADWPQVMIARVLGVQQPAVSKMLTRGRTLLAEAFQSPPEKPRRHLAGAA